VQHDYENNVWFLLEASLTAVNIFYLGSAPEHPSL